VSNRLPILIAEIRAANEACVSAVRTSVVKAIETGKLLIELKELAGHGHWLPSLSEAGLTPRTAQRYMRLASLSPEDATRVSHLGVGAALSAIARKVSPMKAVLDEMDAVVTDFETLIAGSASAELAERIRRCALIANDKRLEGASFQLKMLCTRRLGRFLSPVPGDLKSAQRRELELLAYSRELTETWAQYDDICTRVHALAERDWSTV
jgi:hypothetical protein